MQPLSEEDVLAFAQEWFQGSASDFLVELGRSQLSKFYNNPLLLTVSATIFSETKKIPSLRHQVYKEIISIWLGKAKTPENKEELPGDLWDTSIKILAHMAMAMTERPMQEIEEDLSLLIKDYIKQILQCSNELAEKHSNTFLQVMGRRSGVFVKMGGNYEFIHPTFREYLASVALISKYSSEKEFLILMSRWKDIGWQEIIIFLLGELSEKQDVTPLVKSIWPGRFGFSILQEKALFFAGRIMAERIKIDLDMENKILNGLLKNSRRASWLYVSSPLMILLNIGSRTEVVNGLEILTNDKRVTPFNRVLAASVIGQLGEVEKAENALTSILFKEKKINSRVKIDAVDRLIYLFDIETNKPNAGIKNRKGEDFKSRLVEILLNLSLDKNLEEYEFSRIAQMLDRIDAKEKASIVLLNAAENRKINHTFREIAAKGLMERGATADATKAWNAIAQDETLYRHVRTEAAKRMLELGAREETILVYWDIARNDKYEDWARYESVDSLISLGVVEGISEIVYELAQKNSAHIHRIKVSAEFLEKSGEPDLALKLWEIIARFDDEFQFYREPAILKLCDSGKIATVREICMYVLSTFPFESYRHQKLLDILVELNFTDDAITIYRNLSTNKEVRGNDRLNAAQALLDLGEVDDAVFAFVNLANGSDLPIITRLQAMEKARKFSRGSDVLDACLSIASSKALNSYPFHPSIRQDVAEGIISYSTNMAIQAFQSIAQDEEIDSWYRWEAVKKLCELGQAEIATPVLILLANRLKSKRREDYDWSSQYAIDKLCEIGKTNTIVPILESNISNFNLDNYDRLWCINKLNELNLLKDCFSDIEAFARDESVDAGIRFQTMAILAASGKQEYANILLDKSRNHNNLSHQELYKLALSLLKINLKDESIKILYSLFENEIIEDSLRLDCAEKLSELNMQEFPVYMFVDLSNISQDSSFLEDCAKVFEKIGSLDRASFIYKKIALLNESYHSQKSIQSLGRLECESDLLDIIKATAVDDLHKSYALDEIKKLADVDILNSLVRDESVDTEIRGKAAVALSELKPEKYLGELLLAFATDENIFASYRVDFALAAGKMGYKEEAIKLLISINRSERFFIGESTPSRAARILRSKKSTGL